MCCMGRRTAAVGPCMRRPVVYRRHGTRPSAQGILWPLKHLDPEQRNYCSGAIAAGLMNLGIPWHRLQRAAGRSPGIKATMNISAEAAILTGAGAHFMAGPSGESLSDVSGGSSVLFVWL